MKKVCIALFVIALIGCSTDEPEKSNEDDGEWIKPRQCMELELNSEEMRRCDLDPNCERQSPESNEKTISKLEELKCVIRKTACIEGKVRDDDIECELYQNGEWIQPRQCYELMLNELLSACNFNPNVDPNCGKSIDEFSLFYEERECVMFKKSCIKGKVGKFDIKCNKIN